MVVRIPHTDTQTVLFQSFIQSEAGFTSLNKPLKRDFKGKAEGGLHGRFLLVFLDFTVKKQSVNPTFL